MSVTVSPALMRRFVTIWSTGIHVTVTQAGKVTGVMRVGITIRSCQVTCKEFGQITLSNRWGASPTPSVTYSSPLSSLCLNPSKESATNHWPRKRNFFGFSVCIRSYLAIHPTGVVNSLSTRTFQIQNEWLSLLKSRGRSVVCLIRADRSANETEFTLLMRSPSIASAISMGNELRITSGTLFCGNMNVIQ